MIAYLVLVHDEFEAAADLISRLYDRQNLYCICVNRRALGKALDQLNGLSVLPNVRIIATPENAWGFLIENLVIGIDFCLRFDKNWQSLFLLTGAHVALVPPLVIATKASEEFKDKIVLQVREHPKEFTADRDILKRLFDDPFRRDATQIRDVALCNPFTYSRFSLKRDGIDFYTRPDAMRVGWSRSSHFVTNLTRSFFSSSSNRVDVDTQPAMIRKLLEKYFENRPMSVGLPFGVFPRDFCDFCVNASEATTYFALIRDSFFAEEAYFHTLALDPNFRERIIHRSIVDNAPRPQAILTIEDVDDAVAQGRLFARKAPAGESGREFRAEVYARLGIPTQLDIARLCQPEASGYRERLPELLYRYLRFAGAKFTMGIFADRQLAEFTVLSDLTLEYDHGATPTVDEPAGRRWQWREGGYDAFTADGNPAGRFDGFRIHDGRLFVFGIWPWAESLTLVCVADIAGMLTEPPSSVVVRASDHPAETSLDEHLWRYWSSEREVAEFWFSHDGAIRAADDPAQIAGYWRVDEGRVLAFGLDDMPISLFDRIGAADGRWHLAGVTWGRQSPVEPCCLVSATGRAITQSPDPAPRHEAIDPAKAVEADAPPAIDPISRADLTILPGTAYARYGLPLDYPPSRDYRPRWGRTHPPIASLNEWFGGHAARYEAFLEEMTRSLPWVETIPQDFSDGQLPEPAWFGVPFAPFDALALYTMVRLHRPHTYLEIGSGISTFFAARAVRDHDIGTRIVSIDPQPRRAVDSICNEVIREGLEVCDLARFGELQAGDILFFDGSHRSFMNSDVTVFMIDILPNLKPGVIVHVHDISLPRDYPEMFMDWYWNEQYLLAAYMIGGQDRLDPIFPTAFVCNDARFAKQLARPFIDFGDPHRNSGWRGGGSMWFTHL